MLPFMQPASVEGLYTDREKEQAESAFAYCSVVCQLLTEFKLHRHTLKHYYKWSI